MSETDTIETAVLSHALTETIGKKNVQASRSTLDLHSIDGIVPKAVAFPQSVEQVSDLMALAHEYRLAVIPRGGGTLMGLGNPPRQADFILSLKHLNHLVEYEPADLTATVEAGMTLADFQERLAASGQWLPLDPPLPERATIGGLIAVNANGPHALGFGRLRDLLIGVRAVADDGTIFRSGGKVVKNAAGYDLSKLLTGSLGTLAILVEATFKVSPLPTSSQTMVARFDSITAAADVLRAVLGSPLDPVAMEALGSTSAVATGFTGGSWALLIRYAGHPPAVQRQLRDMGQILRNTDCKEIESVPNHKEQALWHTVADLPDRLMQGRGPAMRVRLSVLPTTAPEAVETLRYVAGRRQLQVVRWARIGTGAVFAVFRARQEDEEQRLREAVTMLRPQIMKLGGSVVVEDAPASVKVGGTVWGPTRSDFPAMRAVKQKYDPKGILNPGRYVGGL